MAVLLDEGGHELLWLSVLCDGEPCMSTDQADPMRFVAPRRRLENGAGRLTVAIRNLAISPACFFSLTRQVVEPQSTWSDGAASLVNDFNLIYRGWEEVVRRDASTNCEMLVETLLSADGSPVLVVDAAAADAARTRFCLAVAPTVRDSWTPPQDLSHAAWRRKTVPSRAPPLNVLLNRGTASPLELQLHPEDTIRQVKLQIQDRTGVPFGENRLTCRGTELEDALLVNFYDVQHGDVLEVKPPAVAAAGRSSGGGQQQRVFVLPNAAHYAVERDSSVTAVSSRETAVASVRSGQQLQAEPRPRHDRGSPPLFFEVFCHHPS